MLRGNWWKLGVALIGLFVHKSLVIRMCCLSLVPGGHLSRGKFYGLFLGIRERSESPSCISYFTPVSLDSNSQYFGLSWWNLYRAMAGLRNVMVPPENHLPIGFQ